MNTVDAITYIAHQEGKRLKPKVIESDVCSEMPYFQLSMTETETQIRVHGYREHDNADRMIYFANYLSRQVLPYIKNLKGLSGYYNIELHDTYSYLSNGLDYNGCLTWCRRKTDNNVVLLPDLYHLCNYQDKLLEIADDNTWTAKNDMIGFWGTTTGSRKPSLNQRINTCLWALDHPDKTDFKITKVAQMTLSDITNEVPSFSKIYKSSGYVTPDDMFKYKFLLDIPGNTCSWDRVPMIMKSKSLLFKMPCQDMCFYYPLMHNKTHFVEVDENTMLKMQTYYLNNPKEADFIIQNANHFANEFFTGVNANVYTVALFDYCAYCQSP
jgi:hypothetical protein